MPILRITKKLSNNTNVNYGCQSDSEDGICGSGNVDVDSESNVPNNDGDKK